MPNYEVTAIFLKKEDTIIKRVENAAKKAHFAHPGGADSPHH